MIHIILAASLYLGDYQNGEIEIIDNPQKRAEVSQIQYERLLRRGLSEGEARESSRLGVVADDVYWIWQRDPVLFPKGAVGTYNRLSWKNVKGIAVLPILPDGRISLNLNFRHATRSWEWELPRGGVQAGEGMEEAARRELQEETGLRVEKLEHLGSMAPDAGVLDSIVNVYAGWVNEWGNTSREESEAISGIYAFTLAEIESGFKDGYIETESHGKVPLRDPFLTYALYQAKSMIQKQERPKIGIGVIVLDGERVLMGQRMGAHGSGTWAFPGGHLEFGETPEACAARELLEETGLKALNIQRSTWTNDLIDDTKHYVTLFMIVDQFEGKLETKEPEKCAGWEWKEWEQLPEPLFHPIRSLKKQNFRPF